MTFKEQLEGIERAIFGVLLFVFSVLIILAFFTATIWTGDVRLLAGVGVGVVLLLGGLVLMSS